MMGAAACSREILTVRQSKVEEPCAALPHASVHRRRSPRPWAWPQNAPSARAEEPGLVSATPAPTPTRFNYAINLAARTRGLPAPRPRPRCRWRRPGLVPGDRYLSAQSATPSFAPIWLPPCERPAFPSTDAPGRGPVLYYERVAPSCPRTRRTMLLPAVRGRPEPCAMRPRAPLTPGRTRDLSTGVAAMHAREAEAVNQARPRDRRGC